MLVMYMYLHTFPSSLLWIWIWLLTRLPTISHRTNPLEKVGGGESDLNLTRTFSISISAYKRMVRKPANIKPVGAQSA